MRIALASSLWSWLFIIPGDVTIDRDWLATQRLNNKVRHNPTIRMMHAWTIGIENARYLDLELVLAVVVKKQRLRASLAFIIA
jgi:peptidoglycan/LPS O-acetylase OafA/YrhL